ncbi:MAG TPA: sigma-54 dependent transcriptional regulator [Nitrospiraceae bacterium]|nr:sigma-54 dependent transcriptional regulator [Nitrospiraceae bacterium]
MADSLYAAAPGRAPFTILIVEDNASDTEILLDAIEQADLRAIEGEVRLEVRASAEGALKVLNEQPIDVVITDMVLPGMNGLDLVGHVQEIDRNLPVLVVTRMSGVQTAVDAIRRGAYDYVLKPVNATDLGMRLHRAIRMSEIVRRHSALERIVQQEVSAGSLVGASQAFHDIMRRIRESAHGRATVLIMGETGTGKGLIARAIHEQSRERDKAYQVIDCTTVPEGMVESELFGHVRGAFTGAVSDKPGLFELAKGGTAFLDEIGELPMAMQAKLLRVLEENEVRPVGGIRVKRVDMRFIAATNQDLEEKVRTGTFRKDLFYRLAAVVIRVPPLRDRREDIPIIARHLLSRFGREMGKPNTYFEGSAMTELSAYQWPGNARELRNVVERALMLSSADAIGGPDIRELLPSNKRSSGSADDIVAYAGEPYMKAKRKALADFTAAYLTAKLAMHAGNISKAAEEAGIPRQHFSLLMKRYMGRDSDAP